MGADRAESPSIAKPLRRSPYAPPSSIGFSLLVQGSDPKLCITAAAAVYKRCGERDERGRFVRREYRRSALECAHEWPSDGRYTETEKMSIEVDTRPHDSGRIITVSLANRGSMPVGSSDRVEGCLFEAWLACEVIHGELVEYPRVDPSLLSDEERELELQYQHRKIYAVGHGTAVDWTVHSGEPARVWAEVMPSVDVPRVIVDPPGTDSDVFVMANLAGKGDPWPRVTDRLTSFVDRYGRWVKDQRVTANALRDRRERDAATRIADRMDIALRRMRQGIALLRRDDTAAQAFRLASRAMRDQMLQSEQPETREPMWRPFQLAFLLVSIESTVREDDEFRDVVDLIWFPTGGGKTEAYLGLIAFLILWRRLTDPATGGGTVAIMRYTLRLLARQQFERACRVILALERLRRGRPDQLGAEPITVGLWVGQAVSPNRCEEAAKHIEQAAAGSGDSETALVLTRCPWCETDFVAPGSYDYDFTRQDFAFLCRNRDCDFGPASPDGPELPCDVVDEAMYRRPPTLLIGTIDKFARLPWEDRASAFFGDRRDPEAPTRPPELVIQDELHLIAGPLGSIAGLYEAGLETVLRRRGVRPKYIASTATIRTAREQVKRLYGRDLAVFPPPGLSADDSWFACVDKGRPGRTYVGYMAPALDRRRCMAPLAAALLAAPFALFAEEQDVDDLYDAWWTHVIYHGSLRDVGNSHESFMTEVRDFARHLDVELEVPKSKGEASTARRAVKQLTSRATAQENSLTFDSLKRRQGTPGCLDVVLATNMISVGVDVDRLASMVINGQPLTTTEYIQASSRIGRGDVPGIVFVNYYRQQARNLSMYEYFRPYHEAFYRFVEPASLTPLTRQVRDRCLHAVLVLAVRHGCSNLRDNKSASRIDERIDEVKSFADDLLRNCERRDETVADQVRDHIAGLVDAWWDDARRCQAARRALYYVARDRGADGLLRQFGDPENRGLWETLNSMRNVEETGVLVAR